MPRANRHYLPGQLWHITHRCHKKEYLLKFARDRRSYRCWLFEAKNRFGLCVFNFVVNILVRLRMERAGIIVFDGSGYRLLSISLISLATSFSVSRVYKYSDSFPSG